MFTVKNIFKSLFSNQAALDNRKMKWYVTLIMFVLAIFLPWIPTLSTGYRSNGGAIFANKNNFEVSTALKHVIAEEDYFKTIKINNKDGAYSLDMNGLNDEAFYGDSTKDSKYNWTNELNGTSDKALFKSSYVDENGNGASPYIKNPTDLKRDYYFDSIGADVTVTKTEKASDSAGTTTTTTTVERRVYLELYMIPGLSRNDANAINYLTNFTTTVILNKDLNGVNHNIPHSYMILLQDYMKVYFYPFTATTATVAASGSYAGKLDEGFAKVDLNGATTLYDFMLSKGELNIQDGFTKNFIALTDGAAREYTIYATWMQVLTLTIAGAASILICTLLIFIFFKRKTSIYRDSNFFHAINTAVNMSITPALLSMLFGFFTSNYSMMAIIGCNLIRAVFVMNRICPPQTADTSKPVYQARS